MERQNARAMKQRAALDARRDGKTLAAAASAAGVAVNTIYKWKQGDPDFAAAWQDASSAQGAFQRSGRPKTAARLARDEHADALLAQIVDTGID